MCGICGIYSPTAPPEPELALRMMAALRHRGPDGQGYFRDQTVVLGHTRLSIIDPRGGTQPMATADERIWITFNGEIFNYLELGRELEARGHRLRTASDTEVAVRAYQEWGTDCFRRFNGQWAMGIWDRDAEVLTLARDRFGIHPLFYTRAGGALLFASEIKALFCCPDVRRELDPRGLDELLTFWSPLAPRTLFAGVEQVRPGTFLTVHGSRETVTDYWSPSFPPSESASRQDLHRNVEELREAVKDATRLRFLRSDVPVGAYLSGGIDSAVTAATITRFAEAELHTFSLRFADDEYDEGGFQRLMSERLGTAHREIVVSENDIARHLPEAVWHAESAMLRSAPVPMMLLSRLVRDAGYKVVVTGEGADEVLAGYDIFREAKVRQFMARDPQSAARARAVELLYPWMKRSPNQAPSFARSFFGQQLDVADPAMSHRPRWRSTGALKALLNPDRLPNGGRDGGATAADELVGQLPTGSADWDPLSRAQWLEIRTLLGGYLLSSQGDRMLMAGSVEGRFPFLDHRLFELAAQIPARQRILGLQEKYLLRQAFADLVPREIVTRAKQPYRAPGAAGFFGPASPDWLGELTSSAALARAGIFKPGVAERVVDKSRRSTGRGLSNSDSMRLMAVLTLQLLHHQFIDSWRSPVPDPSAPVVVFDRRGPDRRAP